MDPIRPTDHQRSSNFKNKTKMLQVASGSMRTTVRTCDDDEDQYPLSSIASRRLLRSRIANVTGLWIFRKGKEEVFLATILSSAHSRSFFFLLLLLSTRHEAKRWQEQATSRTSRWQQRRFRSFQPHVQANTHREGRAPCVRFPPPRDCARLRPATTRDFCI